MKSEEDVELDKLLDQFKEFLRLKKRRQEKDLKAPDEAPRVEKKAAERKNLGFGAESIPVQTEIQEKEQKDQSAIKKRAEMNQQNDLESKAEALPESRAPVPSFRLHQVRGRESLTALIEESSLASSSKESFHVFLEWSAFSSI